MNIEDDLADALRNVRLRNARRINWLRVVGISFFFLVMAIVCLGLRKTEWRPNAVEWIYFGIAITFLLSSEYNSRFLWLTRFAVPVVDIPLVFGSQWLNLQESSVPGQVAVFSVALFLALLMLSAFTLSAHQVLISLGMACLFQQLLNHKAGLGLGPGISNMIVFGVGTWMCVFASQNRLRLVRTVTEANARKERLRRNFSPAVADVLEEGLEGDLAGGREFELTILFADIRDFTLMSDTMKSPQIVSLLNAYHSLMVDAVFRHEGTVDKYLGDGLMAYFNAPLHQDGHADNAIRCAFDMARAIDSLNADRSRRGEPPLRCGIGIHTGPAIVGNIGAPNRREYTAIGQTVNLASRVEGMAKQLDVDVLVSEATAKLARDHFNWKRLGSFQIKGTSTPMSLFQPLQAD